MKRPLLTRSVPLVVMMAAAFLAACGAPVTEPPTLAATQPLPTRAPTLTPSPVPPTRAPTQTPLSSSPSPVPSTATPAAGSTPETGGPAVNPIVPLAAGQPVTVTAIHMLDATTGWAVGQAMGDPDDHVLRTSDGGVTWHDVTPPENTDPAAPLGKAATAFFLDANTAWAAYYDRANGPAAASAVVWRTADAGKTWTSSQPLDTKDAAFYSPSDFAFVNAKTGWLLAHVDAGMMHDYVMVFATSDGGQTWTRVVDPFMDNLPQSCGKTGMVLVDAQTGWVTGDCQGVQPGPPYLQKTTDGGRTWQAVKLPSPPDRADLFTRDDVGCGTYAPAFFSPQSAVLTMKCLFFTANPLRTDSFLYATADGGKTWHSSTLPASEVTFTNANAGWALTATDPNNPTAPHDLYQTGDSGQTWTKIKSVNWGGQIDFVTDQEGWAVAKAGDAIALVHTTDGGKTWKEIGPQVAP
jgi:photosystem II stability/assembly factor-like uncharacterized protein